MVPVTARQVLQSSDTGLKIGQTDVEVQMVSKNLHLQIVKKMFVQLFLWFVNEIIL